MLKLLNGYFIETKEEKIDKVSTKIHKKKLKTCLCSFFELFTKIKENRIEISNLVYNILDNYLMIWVSMKILFIFLNRIK